MKKLILALLVFLFVFSFPMLAENGEEDTEYWYLSRLISEAGEYLPAVPETEAFELSPIVLAVDGQSIVQTDMSSYVLTPEKLNVGYTLSGEELIIEGVNDLGDPVPSQKYTCIYTKIPTLTAVPAVNLTEGWLPEGEYCGSALIQGNKVRNFADDGIKAVFNESSVTVSASQAEITLSMNYSSSGALLLDPAAVDENATFQWLLNGYEYLYVVPTDRSDTIAVIAANKNGTIGFLIYLSQDREENTGMAAISSQYRNGFSDEVFADGVLSYAEYQWPQATSKNLSLDVPDYVWQHFGGQKEEISDDQLDMALSFEQPVICSVSPTGNSGLATLDSAAVAYYNDIYHIIYPAYDKSVEDEYGNFEYWFSRSGQPDIVGPEGVTYSPDGRYAIMTNNRQVIVNSRFNFDPILIDLSTGEAILTATYGNSIAKGNAGAVLSACFSYDSTKLYYMLIKGGGVFSLMCYDIGAMKTETLMTVPYGLINTVYGGGVYYPRLCLTENGSFLVSNSVSRSDLSEGITEFHHEYGPVYSMMNHMYPLPASYGLSCDLLDYSPVSDTVFALYRNANTFMACNVSDGYSGIAGIWAIKSGSYEAVQIDKDHFTDLYDPGQISGPLLKPDYMPIVQAVLSPEGDYALFYVSRMGQGALLMVRLSDMHVVKIRDVSNNEIALNSYISSGRSHLEWNSDKIAILTGDGIKTYIFD